jgi:tRNA G18 (ribose-2'-O)-methylase SpoU
MADLGRPTTEVALEQPKLPFVVVVDNVRSMLNVGAVFRTADAFAAHHLILCGITGQPPHREIGKTALGSEYSVAWVYEKDTVVAIKDLKAQGYLCFALEQAEGSINLAQWEVPTMCSIALVIGNEVEGVQQSVIDLCDGCLEIPQWGHKHSLNVAVAAGVAIWEIAKALKKGNSI